MDWHGLSELGRRVVDPSKFDTLVAGAFGAFAGAVGAQVIISRSQARQAVVAELNVVCAAAALCFSMCNNFLGLKKQCVLSLYEEWTKADAEFQRVQALNKLRSKLRSGSEQVQYELHADLRTLTCNKLPIETLQRHIFERISAPARALAATFSLSGAAAALEETIKNRNELVTEFRQASPNPTAEIVQKYLGLRNADGHVDERFPANIRALHDLTNDCIFFSRLLADDLVAYSKRLRRRHRLRLRFGLPQPSKADWSVAEAAGFMPSDKDYESWLRGFPKRRNRLHRTVTYLRALVTPQKPS
jgi:hypothetical protein